MISNLAPLIMVATTLAAKGAWAHDKPMMIMGCVFVFVILTMSVIFEVLMKIDADKRRQAERARRGW